MKKLMITEGYENAPISPTNLHIRLVKKGYIHGQVSTLSTPKRAEIIEFYANKQLSDVGGTLGDSIKSGSKKSKAEIIVKNAQLTKQVKDAKEQLGLNTQVLLSIVKALKNSDSVTNIERYLSPALIRELNKDIRYRNDSDC